MATDYTGPGGHRIRRRTERCDRTPSKPDTKQREWGNAAYITERRAIEARHDDDGTEREFRRAVGGGDYTDCIDPVSEDSPPCVLRFYGLTSTELGHIERAECATVADVRRAVDHAEGLTWSGCSHGVLRRLRVVLNDFDEVMAAGATPAVRLTPATFSSDC